MTGRTNDQAVSVIVGTLLLILITVTAAAGLAVMISQMQKDEMNRQTHIAAVKNEQVEVLNPQLINDRIAWNQSPLNVDLNQSWSNWSSISFTLTNLNTDDVKVIGIAINDRYTRNFTTLTDTPVPDRVPYNVSNKDYLTIPGSHSQKIQINFTDDFPYPRYISGNEQVRIMVMTSLFNTFDNTFQPPESVITYHAETANLGTLQKDNVVLDGSQSTAANASIVDWNWTIMNATQTVPVGNCNDVDHLSTVNVPPYIPGKIGYFSPSINGPFCVKLTIKDSNGMVKSSSYQLISENPQFVPPSSINLDWDKTTHQLNVTVYDIRKNRVPGQPVDYSIDKQSDSLPFNWTLVPANSISQTDIDGNVTFIVCGNGTATLGSGKLLTKSISFVNNAGSPCI